MEQINGVGCNIPSGLIILIFDMNVQYKMQYFFASKTQNELRMCLCVCLSKNCIDFFVSLFLFDFEWLSLILSIREMCKYAINGSLVVEVL